MTAFFAVLTIAVVMLLIGLWCTNESSYATNSGNWPLVMSAGFLLTAGTAVLLIDLIVAFLAPHLFFVWK